MTLTSRNITLLCFCKDNALIERRRLIGGSKPIGYGSLVSTLTIDARSAERPLLLVALDLGSLPQELHEEIIGTDHT